jgi:Methyltransferase domain
MPGWTFVSEYSTKYISSRFIPIVSSCDYPAYEASYDGIVMPINDNRNIFRLAFDESLGFFDDIPDKDWEFMRNITMRRVNNANPTNPLENSNLASHWYQMNWDPDFSCRHDTKIGIGDGGKVCRDQMKEILDQRLSRPKKT